MRTHNLCFLSKNKKNNVYPCIPQFKKWGLRGLELYRHVFMMSLEQIRSIHADE